MEQASALKAIADDTRRNIIILLLRHNLCVRVLARRLEISEAAVSQHLKVLRQAGLLSGEKKGHFMHYNVNRNILNALAEEIKALADVEREAHSSTEKGCCHKHAYKGTTTGRDKCNPS